jgi:hypothetical protein
MPAVPARRRVVVEGAWCRRSYQVTMIQALPVLIVRAKALIADKDVRGPSKRRRAPIKIERQRKPDQGANAT